VIYVLGELVSEVKGFTALEALEGALNLTQNYWFFSLTRQRSMSEIVLVLATRNKGKKREYELFFKGLPLEIRGLSEFMGIPEYEEQGRTFEEIAINKARSASRVLGLPALADDSGLEVDCLKGAPGILSARYAGESADDYQNNRKLLEQMKGKQHRNATFVCSVALARPTGQVLTFTGRCSGIIMNKPVGTNGFGYDPLFYYPPFHKTFAQLSVEEKSRVSHRGQAMRKLEEDFDKVLIWLDET